MGFENLGDMPHIDFINWKLADNRRSVSIQRSFPLTGVLGISPGAAIGCHVVFSAFIE
jgi:hypothetical protein